MAKPNTEKGDIFDEYLSGNKKRKDYKQLILESEKKYAPIYDSIPLAILLVDMTGTIIYSNSQVENLYEYKKPEYVGKLFTNFVLFNDDDKKTVYKSLKKLLNGEIPGPEEVQLYTKSGNIIWIELHVSIVKFQGKTLFQVISRDINDRKKAEQELIESEKKYRNLIDNLSDIIGELNLKGDITYVSPQIFDILGYQSEEIIGRRIFDLIHPDDVSLLSKNIKNAIIYDKDFSIEFRVMHKNKSYVPISLRGSLITLTDKQKLVGVLRDISDKKEAEIKIKESEEKYRNIVNNITDIILETDLKGIITYISPQCFDIMGYLPEELIGKLAFKYVYSEDLQIVAERMREAINSKKFLSLEYRLIHKNGRSIPVSVRGRVVNLNGQSRIIGAFTDITAQKEVEQKLQESELKFRNITEQSLMGIVIVQDGQFKYANEAALNIIEYSIEDILKWPRNRFYVKLIHPDDLLRVENSGSFISYRIITRLGRIKWIDHYTQPIVYQGKRATLLTFIDVSDKKEAERLIKEENKRLLELNKMRRDLITRASHELKTPLISVYSASQLLLDHFKDHISSEAHEFVELIYKGAQRLKTLIDNLLDASRIESGKLTLSIDFEDIVDIIKECVDDIRYIADQKSLSINLDLPEEYLIKIDKIRIEQVITNLLSNAIKNTPSKGRIDLKLVETKNWIDISIRDTGIGLTDSEKKIIFKRFGKIERTVQEEEIDIEGSGLGLVISKEIAELHGGKILVESKGRNKGSMFTLRLFKEKK